MNTYDIDNPEPPAEKPKVPINVVASVAEQLQAITDAIPGLNYYISLSSGDGAASLTVRSEREDDF